MVWNYFTAGESRNRIRLTLRKSFYMSRSTKSFVGILSFLPIVCLVVFFFMFFRMIPEFMRWEGSDPDPYEVFDTFMPVFLTAIFMSILSIGLLIFFIMHLVRTKNIDTTERIVWVLVLLFAGIIGYPIYWYMRIWNDNTP